jgi:two-component system heavy metal sensor histidine kinase CusS
MSSNPADPAFGRKPRAPSSITARLAVLYAASAFIMLLATTAFLYWVLISGLERADLYFVVDKVHRLEWALQNHPDDPNFLDREVKWESGPHEPEQSHTFYSRILDDQGRLVIETAGMATAVPSAQFPPPVGSERIFRSEVVQHWRSPEGRTYCGLSVRTRNEQSGQSWVIQVAMDDAEEEATIDKVRRASFVALLLGIVLSAGLGGVVARRGMKPLREIAAAAERITANQLKERIDPARQPEELATLATALNRMLGRLEDSFVRMSQFAADVAHELRTPIHNMRGEAEVALSAKRKPAEYRCILESSLEEFARLSRMINEMLFIAHAEDPQRHIERVRFDARREIEAVAEFFDALTESRGVTVSAQGQGIIDADPILFRRAVTNLLSNAVRHTPSGGRITMSVESADGGAVLIKVTDSGCGIGPEHLPRICDRLYCADRTNTQLSEQSGLGLSIVKSIVELHGGSIAIDSALGKGTTVLMRFPAATPATA